MFLDSRPKAKEIGQALVLPPGSAAYTLIYFAQGLSPNFVQMTLYSKDSQTVEKVFNIADAQEHVITHLRNIRWQTAGRVTDGTPFRQVTSPGL